MYIFVYISACVYVCMYVITVLFWDCMILDHLIVLCPLYLLTAGTEIVLCIVETQ